MRSTFGLQSVEQSLHRTPDGIDFHLFVIVIKPALLLKALERCNGILVQAAAVCRISGDQFRYRLNL